MPAYREGFKPKKNCKVCRFIVDQDSVGDKLFERIMKSRAYTNDGEPLSVIARDYANSFTYLGLVNHTKKHQAPTDAILKSNRLGKIAEDHQIAELKEMVNTLQKRNDLIETMFEKAMADPEFWKKLNPNHLLKGLKDQDDVKAKQKDQDMDILKMMMGPRSGELGTARFTPLPDGEPFDPWKGQAITQIPEDTDGSATPS